MPAGLARSSRGEYLVHPVADLHRSRTQLVCAGDQFASARSKLGRSGVQIGGSRGQLRGAGGGTVQTGRQLPGAIGELTDTQRQLCRPLCGVAESGTEAVDADEYLPGVPAADGLRDLTLCLGYHAVGDSGAECAVEVVVQHRDSRLLGLGIGDGQHIAGEVRGDDDGEGVAVLPQSAVGFGAADPMEFQFAAGGEIVEDLRAHVLGPAVGDGSGVVSGDGHRNVLQIQLGVPHDPHVDGRDERRYDEYQHDQRLCQLGPGRSADFRADSRGKGFRLVSHEKDSDTA